MTSPLTGAAGTTFGKVTRKLALQSRGCPFHPQEIQGKISTQSDICQLCRIGQCKEVTCWCRT